MLPGKIQLEVNLEKKKKKKKLIWLDPSNMLHYRGHYMVPLLHRENNHVKQVISDKCEPQVH